ncbi:MAG TPA: peptidase U32 family protein, partial [Negativicutes bacterium]
MIELLAPVGNREALVAAVESGADAVYLAGKLFGARASATNFSEEELADAVRFVHLRGVLVYVTVNTLLDNTEIPVLIRYLQYLYQIGVDAIIVQDIGVAKIVRDMLPAMPVHASTQMTIHNLDGVEFLAEIGFERVVLARESSLADLKHICSNTTIEIESFVHGALCIGYSGQCLMSSLIGGRSGNRGRCAQPCRLPYTLVNKNGDDVLKEAQAGEYLLSPKDFNTLELLPQMIEAGVNSLKIEGRMKRPEYVAVVVDTYRRAIDAYLADKHNYVVTQEDQKDLAQIFNRDFTTAYLEGKQGRNMMSDRRPNNRGVRIGRVISYDLNSQMVTLKLDEPLWVNDIVEFWVKVGGRVSSTVSLMKVKGESVQFAPAG